MDKKQITQNISLSHEKSYGEIRVATSNDEKEKIYRFRYDIFKDELAKIFPNDMQLKQQITDELDTKSLLLYAKSNSEIIGTLRITFSNSNDFPIWLSDIFSIDKVIPLLDNHQHYGLITKFAIAPAYRGSTLMYKFLTAILEIAHEKNIIYFFSGCNPCLLSLYERVGFRRFTRHNFTDPGYGLLVPIVLIPDDAEHFRAVRSPAYRFAKSKSSCSSSVSKLKDIFPSMENMITSQLATEMQLWSYISNKLSGIHQGNTSLFKNLSSVECIKFVRHGSIFSCYKGDCILNQGETTSELYFLLSGTLESEKISIKPGECFGSNLTSATINYEQIMAVTDSEILVISSQSFDRYRQINYKAAKTILLNLEDERLLRVNNKKVNLEGEII